MATKTIALELSVYERLAALKRPGESFTQVIVRLMETQPKLVTCGEFLADALERWKNVTQDEADLMESAVNEMRQRMRAHGRDIELLE
jgi:predicted CopG family antitoxin